MRFWPQATLIFFAYVLLMSRLMPRLPQRKRRLALVGCAIGTFITAAARLSPESPLNIWLTPPAILLLAYWTSGLLFVAPMPGPERVFCRIDDMLRVRSVAAATPRLLAEFLECAYIAVYPVIPLALIVHLTTSAAPDAYRFWTVILATDYICFGVLPWVQTRPPRALETSAPWSAAFREVNVRLLGKTSIQANTFPSGHAAEALAAALLVADAPAVVVTSMAVIALSISAGAVLGRYHYAADVFAGWIVATMVWLVVI